MPIRLILRDGLFHPIDPIPPDWTEGTEVEAGAPLPDAPPQEFEGWVDEIEEIARQGGLDDVGPLTARLEAADREAKEQMRREMGLSR